MAESLARKKRVRAGHRGVVTRRITETKALLGSDTPDLSEVERMIATLEEKLVVLRKLDGEILELLDSEAAIVTDIEEADALNQQIYDLLLRLQKAKITSGTPPPFAAGGGLEPEKGVTSSKQARLPKLTLKPFDGNVTNWFSFWEMYDSAVHSNTELSDIQKFSYLKTLVEDRAQEAIMGLSLTASGYREAVEILKKRFGNKQKIIDKHMNLLMNTERVTSASNIPALRRLYDGIETNMRALKALGIDGDSYGSLLSSVLIQRLPQELKLIVGRQVTGEWNLPGILKVLGQELEARERTTMPSQESVSLPEGVAKRKSEKASVATLVTSQGPSREPLCCYCQRSHPQEDCTTVTKVEERRRILRSSGRCFVCLRKGHIARECRSRYKCAKCKGRHHRSVCQIGTPQAQGSKTTSIVNDGGTTQTTTHLLARSRTVQLNPEATSFSPLAAPAIDGNTTVLLQTATAVWFNPRCPQHQMEGTVVFDSGSQRSYISQTAVAKLGLKRTGSKVLSIVTFGNEDGHKQECDVVRIGLRRKDASNQELTLLSVPSICGSVKTMTKANLKARYPQLAQLDLAEQANSIGTPCTTPVVLIGLDHYWSLVTGESIHCVDGPVATRTTLGWVISGPVSMTLKNEDSTNLVTHVLRVSQARDRKDEGKRLERRLKAFWDLESLGIIDQDQEIYDQFHQIVDFHQGRYVVSLPWKDPLISLPSNYELSLKRLRSLIRRLRQDPELFRQYNQVICEQIESGIVEVVNHPEGEHVHYLPHHAVVKRDSATTKVRVVYDASAKVGTGPSLNESLLIGPKFNQRILDILLRFRLFKTALVADIEKAFLMVGVDRKDRDALRFLWLKDWAEDLFEVQVLRFTRVVFGVASSPFLLNATIRHHLEGYKASQSHLVGRLVESTYVDDVVVGAENSAEAFTLYKDSKKMFQEGGFNLRKFVTNDVELQAKIDESETRVKYPTSEDESETYAKTTLKSVQRASPGDIKILGVLWQVQSDQLIFDLTQIVEAALEFPHPTKRQVASIAGKVYDPLGVLSPVVTPFKIFLQDLSLAKVEWDELLPFPLLHRWTSLIKGLGPEDSQVILPRCTRKESSNTTKYRLRGFGDASLRAYAAVVYLEVQQEHYESEFYLLCSKARVSPVEKLTIPRLELLSALILARLIDRVSEALKSVLTLESPICYLDSKVAYYWISGQDRSWKPFVQNRVAEIRRKVPASRWRHCAGEVNPADAPSRGQSMIEFLNNPLWLNGPKKTLLDDNSSAWRIEAAMEMPQECGKEVRKTIPKLKHSQSKDPPIDSATDHTLMAISQAIGIENMIQLADYSDVDRLFCVTAGVLKAASRFKCKNAEVSTIEWLNRAEVIWVKSAQGALAKDSKYLTWKTQFGLFEDEDGQIRCRGRLSNAMLAYSTRYPLLLPRDHGLTALLVRRAHERVFHNGVKETLTELRTKFWVLKGRKLVQSIINKCVLCRKLEGSHYRGPPPPPLPSFRVEESPPFAYCGVDFAGPLFVKMDRNSPCTSKVWICLYTCCVTRAVHLDLVQDLTTQSFLRSFKRFVARRGIPLRMISDNGKTFKGAARVMKNEVQRQLVIGVKVEWTFNIERAPWWGGFFERLIQSTKRCLKKMAGRNKLLYDELLTLITEVESILNSRPLSYVSSHDLEEPLTPSHLIMGRRLLTQPGPFHPPHNDEDYTVEPSQLSKRVQFLTRTVEHFWNRWRKEYLIDLRSVHARNIRVSHAREMIKQGDVVIIHDDNERRSLWKLGVVEELIPGRDGKFRGARVRVSVGGRRTTSWKRPVERLYPLEIGCIANQPTPHPIPDRDLGDEVDDPPKSSESEVHSHRSPKLKRRAAIEARNRLEDMYLD